MGRALLVGVWLVAGCGARSALDPADGEQAFGGSAGVGAADVGGAGGQPPGVGGNGGEGPQGGEGPLCLPAVCDGNWDVTLPQQDLPGYLENIATDPCGNITIASIKAEDATWVAQLDASGALKWARNVAPYQYEYAGGRTVLVAGTPSGEVIVALTYEVGFSIDGVLVNNDGELDTALMRLDSGGNLEWVKSFGTPDTERPTALAVTPDGDILLGGDAGAGIDLGGGPIDDGLFLARFSSTGEHIWSYRFAEAGQGADAFSFLPNGDFWMLGRARRDIQFPGGSLLDGGNFADRVLVARLTSDGSEVSSAIYGGDGTDLFFRPNGFDIASAAGGGARFVAALTGPIDFGGGVLQIGDPPFSAGLADVELAEDGSFISASQLLVPVVGVSSAIGPTSVFVGQWGLLVEVGDAGPMTLASFGPNQTPELARVDDGLITATYDDALAGTIVSRLCDQP